MEAFYFEVRNLNVTRHQTEKNGIATISDKTQKFWRAGMTRCSSPTKDVTGVLLNHDYKAVCKNESPILCPLCDYACDRDHYWSEYKLLRDTNYNRSDDFLRQLVFDE
jgi:hypothetical protein